MIVQLVELRGLFSQYIAETAPGCTPCINHNWGTNSESAHLAIYTAEIEQIAFAIVDASENLTAAKMLERIIQARHDHAKARATKVAEERAADDDFAETIKSSDADEKEPE